MPFLKETSQWTQILSRRDSPTSSLVRLAAISIRCTLDKIEGDIRALRHSTLKTNLIAIHEQLIFWAFGDNSAANKGYIGEEYTSYWAWRVAEFLDCRTYRIFFSDRQFVTSELLPDLVSVASITIPRRTAISRRAMSEEDRYLEGSVTTPEHPLEVESKSYMIFMRDNIEEDPLRFWSKNQARFPILAAVARRVLSIPATLASTERLFSASGRVCTFDRSSLKPATVDILSTLHVWGKSEED